MDAHLFTDAEAFAAVAAPVIAAQPVAANMVATTLDAVLGGSTEYPNVRWFALVPDDGTGEAAGLAMFTSWGLNVTPLLTSSPTVAAADALAARVHAAGLAVTAVSGLSDFPWQCAAAWQALTGATPADPEQQWVYQLTELRSPSGIAGRARLAEDDDLSWLGAWMLAFEREITGRDPRHEVRPGLAASVSGGRMVLWLDDDDHPVSVAGVRPPVAGLSRVGPVFTPVEHRRHGYASAVTAAATQRGFDLGAERLMLFTQASNPTSNHIYADLGYHQVGPAQLIRFA